MRIIFFFRKGNTSGGGLPVPIVTQRVGGDYADMKSGC